MHNWFYIAKTLTTGKGIFSKRKFKKNSTLFIIRGKEKIFSRKIKSDIGHRWIGIGKNKWLAPRRDNPLWYLNHSCRPNCVRVGMHKIIALRDIFPDEEIRIDYSTTEEDSGWSMICRCGEQECRKIIKSIIDLPISVFSKYQKYISNYYCKLYFEALKHKGINSFKKVQLSDKIERCKQNKIALVR